MTRNASNYGEWDRDVLSGTLMDVPGDALDVASQRTAETYGGIMRPGRRTELAEDEGYAGGRCRRRIPTPTRRPRISDAMGYDAPLLDLGPGFIQAATLVMCHL